MLIPPCVRAHGSPLPGAASRRKLEGHLEIGSSGLGIRSYRPLHEPISSIQAHGGARIVLVVSSMRRPPREPFEIAAIRRMRTARSGRRSPASVTSCAAPVTRQTRREMALHVRPFVPQDAVHDAVPHRPVASRLVVPEDAVLVRAESFDGALRANVEAVGAKAHCFA